MTPRYIHRQPDWPDFRWDRGALAETLAAARYRQGLAQGRLEAMGPQARLDAQAESVVREALDSSRIEGERLNTRQVRASAQRRLSDGPGSAEDPEHDEDGIVAVLVDATARCGKEVDEQRLLTWHSWLFPRGRSGLQRIRTGAWRTGPVQVVSGPAGREQVHFDGPEAGRVPGEMRAFLDWFNSPPETGGALRAGIAHLRFVAIHPFEDGNGRIARALTDMALARSQQSPLRLHSMSHRILRERAGYYRALENATRGSCDITGWLSWFTGCLGRAMDDALEALSAAQRNTVLRERAAGAGLNGRQLRVLELLMREPHETLTAARWARIGHSTLEEAESDIAAVMAAELLEESPREGVNPRYRLPGGG